MSARKINVYWFIIISCYRETYFVADCIKLFPLSWSMTYKSQAESEPSLHSAIGQTTRNISIMVITSSCCGHKQRKHKSSVRKRSRRNVCTSFVFTFDTPRAMETLDVFPGTQTGKINVAIGFLLGHYCHLIVAIGFFSGHHCRLWALRILAWKLMDHSLKSENNYVRIDIHRYQGHIIKIAINIDRK